MILSKTTGNKPLKIPDTLFLLSDLFYLHVEHYTMAANVVTKIKKNINTRASNSIIHYPYIDKRHVMLWDELRAIISDNMCK